MIVSGLAAYNEGAEAHVRIVALTEHLHLTSAHTSQRPILERLEGTHQQRRIHQHRAL